MNSGSGTQTTMSSTTIATRSMPIVSWTSIACAIATLVPTPSVDVASNRSSSIRNNPAKPPSPPTTSGRVDVSRDLISSTARSPAAMSTPAAAYVAEPSRLTDDPDSRTTQGVLGTDARRARRHPFDLRGSSGAGDALEHVLPEQLRSRQVDGVLAVEAGAAELVGLDGRRGRELLERDVAEGVRADRRADLVDRQAVGDELGERGEVDAVEARPLHRWRGDADVYLGRPGLAQHAHDGPLGVAADDRVVDDDDPLAGDRGAERVELEADAELTDRVGRLDEGAADVRVLHQSRAVRDPRALGEPDRGRCAALRHRDDQVCLHRRLACEPATHLDAGLVHRATGDRGVGSGEVDVLEQAALRRRLGEPLRAQAVLVDRDQLTGFDLAHERRADDVERRCLGRDHPAALQPAEHQRTHSVRVAGG